MRLYSQILSKLDTAPLQILQSPSRRNLRSCKLSQVQKFGTVPAGWHLSHSELWLQTNFEQARGLTLSSWGS